MSTIKLTVLIVRENNQITRIAIPDLKVAIAKPSAVINARGYLDLITLQALLQKHINNKHISHITPQQWRLKEEEGPDDPYKYKLIEVSVEMPSCYWPSRFAFVFFLGALGVAEYLSYYTNLVTEVPQQMAIGGIATDIFSQLVQYIISDVSENINFTANKIVKRYCAKSSHNIQGDFIYYHPTDDFESYHHNKSSIILVVTAAGIQLYNLAINSISSYNNQMYLYQLACDQKLFNYSCKTFMTIAKTSFWVDTGIDFIVPISMAMAIAPKIQRLLPNHCCSNKAQKEMPQEKKGTTEEKKPREEKLSSSIHGFFPQQQQQQPHIINIQQAKQPLLQHKISRRTCCLIM
jgi:hypothetical protein